jgi:outer membrane protein
VDSDRILEQLPEFRTAQQEIDRQATVWQAEVDAVVRDADALQTDFNARELLFTDEERTRKVDEITAKRQEADALRRRYFGPEGELFREQQNRMRPVQERILVAIEKISQEEGYDYVFDRSGDLLFLYARDRFDLTPLVLDELGVGVGAGR